MSLRQDENESGRTPKRHTPVKSNSAKAIKTLPTLNERIESAQREDSRINFRSSPSKSRSPPVYVTPADMRDIRNEYGRTSPTKSRNTRLNVPFRQVRGTRYLVPRP